MSILSSYGIDFDTPSTDPSDILESVYRSAGIRSSRRPRSQPYGLVTPEDEASVFDRAKKAAGSGLELLGDIGDTFGGRALRGALGGNFRELLSVLPFSDTIGITDESQEVTGRDLLEQWGLAGANEDGLDAGDLGGFGLEVALDPSTYLTFGASALGKGGKIAKMIGQAPKTARARVGGTLRNVLEESTDPAVVDAVLAGRASAMPGTQIGKATRAATDMGLDLASVADEKLGGLAGVGLPFMEPAAVFGTGERAQQLTNYLGKGMDWLGQTLPGRGLRAMFDKSVEGRISGPLQESLSATSEAAERGKTAAEEFILGQARKLQDAGEYDAITDDLLRGSLEGTVSPLPGTALEEVVGNIRGRLHEAPLQEELLGVHSPTRESYAPRQKSELDRPTPGFEDTLRSGGSSKGISPTSPHLITREEIFDVPGGTQRINELAMDARLSSPNRSLAQKGKRDLSQEANIIRKEYLDWTPQKQTELDTLQNKATRTPAEEARFSELDKTYKQADSLADWAAGLDPQYAKDQKRFFGESIFKDVANRLARGERVKARAQAIQMSLAKDALPSGQAPMDWLPFDEVLAKSGLTGSGAQDTALKELAKLGKAGPLGDFRVSRQLANDISNMVTLYQRPEALEPFIKAWDSLTTLFKTGVTTVWPKKHIRDFTQGMFQNFARQNPAEFVRNQTDAIKLWKNGETLADANKIPGLEKLSPEEATKKLADEMAAREGFFTERPTRQDAPGKPSLSRYELPGEKMESVRETLTPSRDSDTSYWKFWEIAGVGDRKVTKFGPAVAGAKIEELTSRVNRGALYLAKRRAGFDPDAAFAEVVKAHYDFSNLTGFERSVMKRLIPFYSWQKQNLPATIKRLIEQPGGVEATAIKGAEQARSEGFVPEYLGAGLAVPIGGEEGGAQRFLSKLDLPFEDVIKTASDFGSMKMLGGLNPLLKAPLELGIGEQLHTGRKLEDLYPITGNTAIDEVIANSPFARVYSTARPFVDERKGLGTALFNTLSPASVTDVDMVKQKDIALRKMLEEELKGSKNIAETERFFVKPENLAKLTPEERQLLRVYQQAEAERKKRNKLVGVQKRGSAEAFESGQ